MVLVCTYFELMDKNKSLLKTFIFNISGGRINTMNNLNLSQFWTLTK